MRKSEVRVGHTYLAKVSGRAVPVRIIEKIQRRTPTGYRTGWLGVSLATGREIRIRSAQRLRQEVTACTKS